MLSVENLFGHMDLTTDQKAVGLQDRHIESFSLYPNFAFWQNLSADLKSSRQRVRIHGAVDELKPHPSMENCHIGIDIEA